MRFEDQRELLVNELRRYGIKDENVLTAFSTVKRELFVPQDLQIYSYRNQPLPIAYEQTISQPLMIAIMLEQLHLQKDDIVLEIGTGSGYEAAILSQIVKEVCTIERIEGLSLSAQSALRSAGCKNVYFRIGDGSKGWNKAFPPYTQFSKIIVSAAAASIPVDLVNQLADNGIMVIPVGKGFSQTLIKLEKSGGTVIQSDCGGCTFVPLITDSQ